MEQCMPYSAGSPDRYLAWRDIKSRYPAAEAWLLAIAQAAATLAISILLRWVVS